MVVAIWTTIVLLVAALATAMTLGWRKWTAQPVRVEETPLSGTSCFPSVCRDRRTR